MELGVEGRTPGPGHCCCGLCCPCGCQWGCVCGRIPFIWNSSVSIKSDLLCFLASHHTALCTRPDPHTRAFETLCGWRTETGSLVRVFECLQEKNSHWGVLFIWEMVWYLLCLLPMFISKAWILVLAAQKKFTEGTNSLEALKCATSVLHESAEPLFLLWTARPAGSWYWPGWRRASGADLALLTEFG